MLRIGSFLGKGRETNNRATSAARRQILNKQEQTIAAREVLGKQVPAARHMTSTYRHPCLDWDSNPRPLFERLKTVHALERTATAIAPSCLPAVKSTFSYTEKSTAEEADSRSAIQKIPHLLCNLVVRCGSHRRFRLAVVGMRSVGWQVDWQGAVVTQSEVNFPGEAEEIHEQPQ